MNDDYRIDEIPEHSLYIKHRASLGTDSLSIPQNCD